MRIVKHYGTPLDCKQIALGIGSDCKQYLIRFDEEEYCWVALNIEGDIGTNKDNDMVCRTYLIGPNAKVMNITRSYTLED